MDTLNVLLTIAAVLTVIFFITVIARRPHRNSLVSITTSNGIAEIRRLANQSIKEINKRDFQFIEEGISDNLFIYSNIALANTVTVKIVVQNGGALLFYGTTTENIIINSGGSAIIYGTVVGEVINNGGELHIYGRIIGYLEKHAGQTEIYSTAQVLQEHSPD